MKLLVIVSPRAVGSRYSARSYHALLRIVICTTESMTGTSTNTPTTVASAAPELNPNSTIAVTTASSKKLLAPMRADGRRDAMGHAELTIEQVSDAGVEIDLDQDWNRQHCDNQRLIKDLFALKTE